MKPCGEFMLLRKLMFFPIDLKNYEKFIAMKKKNPKLKVLVAIGGWTDSQNHAGAYSKLFRNEANRATFVKYVLLNLHNYFNIHICLFFLRFPSVNF